MSGVRFPTASHPRPPSAAERVAVAFRVPWRRYQGKTREASVLLRAYARGRWRFVKVSLSSPWRNGDDRGQFSWTLEAKTWLTDEGMRGNLRRKTFARVGGKLGVGGSPIVKPGRCPAFSERGAPCTWERGHVPMLVRWHHPGRRANQGDTEFPHSFFVKRGSLREGDVIQEPRRPRTPRPPRRRRDLRPGAWERGLEVWETWYGPRGIIRGER